MCIRDRYQRRVRGPKQPHHLRQSVAPSIMKCSVEPACSSRIQHISFNQQHQFFAVGTNTGFSIYSCEPFKLKQHQEFPSNGGIGVAEMLFQTNILALVGGGREPRWPPNEVKLWDVHQEKELGWLTFKHEVKNVKMRRDIVAAVLEESVVIHRFEDLSNKIQTVQTARNPKGICALSAGATSVMAIPGPEDGSICVLSVTENKQHIIRKAHDSPLAALAINLSATRIASASTTGTLIRVFDARSGKKLQELRRGMDYADICSLSFNHTSQWLCAASDKGTVHVFSCAESCLENNQTQPMAAPARQYDIPGAAPEEEPAANPKSSLAWFQGYLPIAMPKYFDSEWSFAQLQLPAMKRSCAFGSDGMSIFAVGEDGIFYHGSFNPHEGGPCDLLVKESLF
eukprot:TRINITY_DN27763_c0_g1_i1.p1 TRINITY_DN27763_c0_g1~~TRINITY_DN27763_c0_g1_i1.p1  ORF type:complete len:399 (+),score=85.52 TRINITY_DN27763_c0_g1_i1:139-1335(+)